MLLFSNLKKSFYSILHILEIMLRIWALQYRLVGEGIKFVFFSPLSVIRAFNPAPPPPPPMDSTPVPPAQAQAPASSTNPSPRKQRNAAAGVAARGPKHAKQQSEDEIFLSVLQEYEKNSLALIFCVDEYPTANAKDGSVMLRDLDCAVADGKTTAAMLRQQGFDVNVFENGQVTKDTIERELGKVIQRFPYNSPTMGRLYIMYAGHGLRDEATGSSVFCCADYSPDNSYMTSYPLNELKNKLQHIGVKHHCVHLDCCHAGGIFAATPSREIPFSAVQHAKMPVVQAITAVTRDEQALESDGNGLFTKFLCEEITESRVFERYGADVVTLSQVFNVARGKVTEKARESRGKMTPMHKDVLNEHLKETCCGEMLFFRPGTTSEKWALKSSAAGASTNGPTATERGVAAAAQATLSSEMRAWVNAQNIQGVQDLANALDNLGLTLVSELKELDEEDMEMICSALKKFDAKKFRKGVEKKKKKKSRKAVPLALYKACERGDVEAAREELGAEGVDVNERGEEGRSPLYVACEKGSVGLVNVLLAADGTDPNQARGKSAEDYLHWLDSAAHCVSGRFCQGGISPAPS